MYENYKHICNECKREKYWYNFPYKNGIIQNDFCFHCLSRIGIKEISSKIHVLIMKANNSKMTDLRNHLFDCLEQVKSKRMSIEEAKAACMIAQTIINTAKLEIDFIKVIGGTKKSEFFQLEDSIESNGVEKIGQK